MPNSETQMLVPYNAALRSAYETGLALAHTAEYLLNTQVMATQDALTAQTNRLSQLENGESFGKLFSIQCRLMQDLGEISTSYFANMYTALTLSQIAFVWRTQTLTLEKLDDIGHKLGKTSASSTLYWPAMRMAYNTIRMSCAATLPIATQETAISMQEARTGAKDTEKPAMAIFREHQGKRASNRR